LTLHVAFDLLHLFNLSVFADGHHSFPDVEPAPTHMCNAHSAASHQFSGNY
jgi:hypothetical protein